MERIWVCYSRQPAVFGPTLQSNNFISVLDGGRRKFMTAEEEEAMKTSTPLGAVEKSPMMSVYLIADLVGFPRPAGAAIYEVKISKTGGGIVVGIA